MSAATIHVVAAVVENGGRFLVTRRQAGVHLAGLWEFPGGKVAAGESHEEALRREMQEELDTDVEVREMVSTATHAYGDRHVTLRRTLQIVQAVLAGTQRTLQHLMDELADGFRRLGSCCLRLRFRRGLAR